MMKIVMPMMERGIIINVSSLMAVYPMPLLTTYAACKVWSKIIKYNNRKLIKYIGRKVWNIIKQDN